MTIEDSAYIAVLQNKLAQAERSLHEFNKIFQHWTNKVNGGGEVYSLGPEKQQITVTEEECLE